MATETSASGHTSATDEQVAKKEKEEGIGEKSDSLCSENEDKADKCGDAQGPATPLTKTGGEAEVENTNDSLAMATRTSAEDNLKIEEDKQPNAALVKEEKIDDSPSLESSVADNLKTEKQFNPESPLVSLIKTPLEPPPIEKESANTREDNLKIADDTKLDTALVDEAKIEDSSSLEASVANDLKAEEQLIPDSPPVSAIETLSEPPPTEEELTETKGNNLKTEDKKLDATLVEEEKIDDSVSLEAFAADNLRVEKQLISESPPFSVIEAPLEAPPTEEESTKTREDTLKTEQDTKTDATLVKEENIDDSSSLEASVADNVKPAEKQLIPELAFISFSETPSEPPPAEEELVETRECQQPHTPDFPTTVDLHIESEAEAAKEAENSEVQEKSLEPEKKSQQEGQEEQPNIDATPKSLVETIEKQSVTILETAREAESDAECVVATKVEENPSESEKLPCQKGEEEQLKTVIPATLAESTEQPSDIVEIHAPNQSDDVSTDGEEKPIEHLEMAEEVKEQSNDAETKQQIVGEFANIEGTSDDIVKPMPSKQVEETSVTGRSSTAQVSLNEKAQFANEAEASPGVAEKVVEEDDKKERSCIEMNEVVSKEEEGVLENPERVSVNQEAHKTDQSVAEKVAANDVVEGLSREAETATAEEQQAKLEGVKDDQPADDNEKEEEAETKVDEIAPAAREPVRETLASKLERKEEEEDAITTGAEKLEKETVEEHVKTGVQIPEPPTKESDATKTSKETPAKPHQKHSNNILSKVKQSLVKAKKAITGKSPTPKTLSSETKADIQVK